MQEIGRESLKTETGRGKVVETGIEKGRGTASEIGKGIRIWIDTGKGNGIRIVIDITEITTDTEVRKGRGPEIGMIMLTTTETETMKGEKSATLCIFSTRNGHLLLLLRTYNNIF